MREDRVERFIRAAERMRLEEYVRYASDRRRRLTDAFLQGIARGLGITFGFAVLGAVLLFVLQKLAESSLPAVSEFIAQIVTLVNARIR